MYEFARLAWSASAAAHLIDSSEKYGILAFEGHPTLIYPKLAEMSAEGWEVKASNVMGNYHYMFLQRPINRFTASTAPAIEI